LAFVSEIHHCEGEWRLVLHHQVEAAVEVGNRAAGHVLHLHHGPDNGFAGASIMHAALEPKALGLGRHRERGNEEEDQGPEQVQSGARVG